MKCLGSERLEQCKLKMCNCCSILSTERQALANAGQPRDLLKSLTLTYTWFTIHTIGHSFLTNHGLGLLAVLQWWSLDYVHHSSFTQTRAHLPVSPPLCIHTLGLCKRIRLAPWLPGACALYSLCTHKGSCLRCVPRVMVARILSFALTVYLLLPATCCRSYLCAGRPDQPALAGQPHPWAATQAPHVPTFCPAQQQQRMWMTS